MYSKVSESDIKSKHFPKNWYASRQQEGRIKSARWHVYCVFIRKFIQNSNR